MPDYLRCLFAAALQPSSPFAWFGCFWRLSCCLCEFVCSFCKLTTVKAWFTSINCFIPTAPALLVSVTGINKRGFCGTGFSWIHHWPVHVPTSFTIGTQRSKSQVLGSNMQVKSKAGSLPCGVAICKRGSGIDSGIVGLGKGKPGTWTVTSLGIRSWSWCDRFVQE